MAFFSKKAGKAVANLGGVVASAVRAGNSDTVSPQTRASTPDDSRQRVASAYNNALLGYVPKPYSGRVTLLWPGELPLDDPRDPSAGWKKVANQVDIHAVAGGHISCVTSNVRNLAETLRACLEKTQTGNVFP